MPSSRREKLHRRIVVTVVATQLPAVLALIAASGPWLAGLVVPVVLTSIFFMAYQGPYNMNPRSDRHRLVLRAFFAWWIGCCAFTLLAPVGLVAGAAAWPWLAGAAATVGLASIRPYPRVRRVTLRFPELPAALDGLTIAQLSDLHCGPWVPEARVASWVRRANALGAEVVAVTGDLIARGTDHVAAVARALGGLRARRGVFVCMGNHDYFGAGEVLVRALEDSGLTVLRNEAQVAGDGLAVAGVDDAWTRRDDLDRALARCPEGAFVVLLAHDPALFPAAAERGVQLTLSGHTHAGQIALPFFEERWNLARFVHEFSMGVYRNGGSVLYVNPGLGWSGPPVRVGARAEITLIKLLRAPT